MKETAPFSEKLVAASPSNHLRALFFGAGVVAVPLVLAPGITGIIGASISLFFLGFLVVTERGAERGRESELVDMESSFESAIAARTHVLEQERDDAHEKTAARGRFLAHVSHEIRTPMNGIVGMTDLLLSSHLDEDQTSFAKTVRSSSQALLAILNDILDISKIESGKLEIEMADFDLREMLEGTTRLLSPIAFEKNLAMRVDIDESIPRFVRGDGGRLRQVLTNLIGNAIKFTAEGSVEVSVQSTTYRSGDHLLRIEVKDSGIGIPADSLPHIFDAFHQAESSTTRRFGGTGLGLTISRELAQKMGGSLGVESEAGSGSTFWFTVELEPGDPEAVAPIPAALPCRERSSTAMQDAEGSRRVLLVEDDAVSRRVALLHLERAGFEVIQATDGRQALELLDEHDIDLVLMDCEMPELDGYQATLRIRSRRDAKSELPVIAMTANAMLGDRQKCLDSGMNDYITKPFEGQALLELVSVWCSGSEAPEPLRFPVV